MSHGALIRVDPFAAVRLGLRSMSDEELVSVIALIHSDWNDRELDRILEALASRKLLVWRSSRGYQPTVRHLLVSCVTRGHQSIRVHSSGAQATKIKTLCKKEFDYGSVWPEGTAKLSRDYDIDREWQRNHRRTAELTCVRCKTLRNARRVKKQRKATA